MRWHLIIDEFGPQMELINGPKNIVADTLSRLEMSPEMSQPDMSDSYGLNSDDLTNDIIPISYTLLDHEQKKDKALLKHAQSTTRAYFLKQIFMGAAIPFTYCVSKTR